jgi:hypothetical protein
MKGDMQNFEPLAEVADMAAFWKARKELFDEVEGICTDKERLWFALGRSVREAKRLFARDEFG